MKKYNFCGTNGAINCLSMTPDSESLFVGYRNGFLRQVQVTTQRVEKDYGWIDKGGIRSLYTTNDGRW